MIFLPWWKSNNCCFGKDFQAMLWPANKNSLYVSWSVCVFLNTLKGLLTHVVLQAGFLIDGSGFLPLGSFTSVTPGALWRSAWGRLAQWRKVASSPRSSSKSLSHRCCYRTSWLWAWGKKNRVVKSEFSFVVFWQFYSVLMISHQTDSKFHKSIKAFDLFISPHWWENVL